MPEPDVSATSVQAKNAPEINEKECNMPEFAEREFDARERVFAQGPWRVVFRRHVDRWRHTIYCLRSEAAGGDDIGDEAVGEASLPLLESLEGSPEEPWPTSPPWQSVHIESRDSGQVALLMGMAGGSHWSASIESSLDGALIFDIACRVSGEAGDLGSAYKTAPGIRFDPLKAQLVGASGTCAIEFDSPQNGPSNLEPQGAEQFRIKVATPQIRSPATIRWRYSLRPV